MALSWRSRALALIAPFLLAVALAAAVSGRGCDEGDAGPTEAVRVFLSAAADLDRERMFELLGPKTREKLESAAAEATDRSSRRYVANEMLGIDSGLRELDLERPERVIRLESRDGDSARVSVRDRAGAHHSIALIRADGRWLIELD